MTALILILRREMRLALRQIGDSAIIVLFFVLAAVLFPFGVGPEPNMLARMAPGVVWVTALLAAMLSFERLFTPDFEDGSLEQLALGPAPPKIVPCETAGLTCCGCCAPPHPSIIACCCCIICENAWYCWNCWYCWYIAAC